MNHQAPTTGDVHFLAEWLATDDEEKLTELIERLAQIPFARARIQEILNAIRACPEPGCNPDTHTK